MKLNQEQFPTYKSLLPVQFIPTISEYNKKGRSFSYKQSAE